MTVNQFGANIGIGAWEIDFFGRIRSLSDAALQKYFATEQANRSAHILLVSEVGKVYLALAADRDILKLAETTLETQQAAYDLVKCCFDRGLVPKLDLYRSQTQVDTARASVVRSTRICCLRG